MPATRSTTSTTRRGLRRQGSPGPATQESCKRATSSVDDGATQAKKKKTTGDGDEIAKKGRKGAEVAKKGKKGDEVAKKGKKGDEVARKGKKGDEVASKGKPKPKRKGKDR